MTSSTAGTSTPKRSAPMRKTRNRAAPSRNMGNHVDEFRDGTADVLQWSDAVGTRALDRGLRHAVDRRRLAVLNDGEPTGLADGACSFGAVATHSRENDRNRRRAEHRRGGTKQEIGGWSYAPEGGRLVEPDHRALTV